MCDAQRMMEKIMEQVEQLQNCIIASGANGDAQKGAPRQMALNAFLKEHGMSRSTVERLIHRHADPLPAFKIGQLWYVDINQYYKWRVREDRRCRMG